jgi:AcrR family transcriptional regulator
MVNKLIEKSYPAVNRFLQDLRKLRKAWRLPPQCLDNRRRRKLEEMKTRPSNFKGLDKSIRMQKIVEAATNLFHKKGFKAATLDEVARELEVSKAALYHYIPGKGELLAIIYNQAFAKIFHRIYAIAALDISPAEKLRQIIRDHICNIITSNIAMFSVFFAEENQFPPEDFQKIREEKIKYTKLVIKIIEEGMAAGDFRPMDARLMANAILGMCNWLYKWYKPGKETFRPEEIADHFIKLLEAGYLKPRADSQPAAGPPQSGDQALEKQTLMELKALCQQLSTLIERLGP